mmetsp:Transcript_5240/g.22273  ORF Transcript_5240/g.22273 Transcript_5240/m.22273 type:complete len:462 (+) Transcript_5240:1523-2908(+)
MVALSRASAAGRPTSSRAAAGDASQCAGLTKHAPRGPCATSALPSWQRLRQAARTAPRATPALPAKQATRRAPVRSRCNGVAPCPKLLRAVAAAAAEADEESAESPRGTAISPLGSWRSRSAASSATYTPCSRALGMARAASVSPRAQATAVCPPGHPARSQSPCSAASSWATMAACFVGSLAKRARFAAGASGAAAVAGLASACREWSPWTSLSSRARFPLPACVAALLGASPRSAGDPGLDRSSRVAPVMARSASSSASASGTPSSRPTDASAGATLAWPVGAFGALPAAGMPRWLVSGKNPAATEAKARSGSRTEAAASRRSRRAAASLPRTSSGSHCTSASPPSTPAGSAWGGTLPDGTALSQRRSAVEAPSLFAGHGAMRPHASSNVMATPARRSPSDTAKPAPDMAGASAACLQLSAPVPESSSAALHALCTSTAKRRAAVAATASPLAASSQAP